MKGEDRKYVRPEGEIVGGAFTIFMLSGKMVRAE